MKDLLPYSHLINTQVRPTRLVKEKYNTSSIIQTILEQDLRAYQDVNLFAKAIHADSLYDLTNSIFEFIKQNIKYVEDGMMFQGVQSPAHLWKSKKGDCKSMTIFSCAILRALNIPYTIRFVSYSNSDVYTHVYCIAHGLQNSYIIDPVWALQGNGAFNTEKAFTNKKDYNMSGGLYMMGTSAQKHAYKGKRKSGRFYLPENHQSEAAMDLAIARQRLEIERDMLSRVGAIGKASEYSLSIGVVAEMQSAVDNNDFDTMEQIISGIAGKGKGKALLKKVAAKAKAGVKTLTKVVTTPARLVAKGAIEVVFPVVAPLFLYLFISPTLLPKSPKAVQAKRKKQDKVANFIVNAIGMKRDHFMIILRHGIMKKYNKSPEAVLSENFKGITGINGIGFVALIALVPKIIALIQKIASMFGKKDASIEADAKDMAPGDGDWKELMSNPSLKNAALTIASKLRNKNDTQTAPGKSMEEVSDDISQDDYSSENASGKKGPSGWCS